MHIVNKLFHYNFFYIFSVCNTGKTLINVQKKKFIVN